MLRMQLVFQARLFFKFKMEKQRCGNILKPCMGALPCTFFEKNLNISRQSGLYEAE